MRDGTILRADVYRPDEGRHPVLLQRTPYNKEFWPFTFAVLDPIRTSAAGYVVVIQDIRARFASDGDVYFIYRDEFDDGFDSVEWCASQEWSDGQVCCYGISHMGATARQAAATQPKELRGIATATAPHDFIRNHIGRGGALNWGMLVSWSLTLGTSVMLRRGSDAAAILGLIDHLDDYNETVKFLPPRDLPGTNHLGFFHDTMAEPFPNSKNRSYLVADRHVHQDAPQLILAGWYDFVLGGDLDHYEKTKREDTRLVIGPWAHAAFAGVVGELDFGLRANGATLDFAGDLTNLHTNWFDYCSKDAALPGPPVKLFVMGQNRWRDENEWPLARANDEDWYLGKNGSLSRQPQTPDSDTYTYDPADPCPTRGGNLLLPATYARGPADQNPILERADVRTYTSDVLTEALEVTGYVKAILFASTTAPDTDWVVKLCDVHPDGRTFNVCDGILRARHRQGLDKEILLETGEVQRYEIDCWATSQVFKAGHRIRVLVTSSDFPRYDRNPNTGVRGADATELVKATQKIFIGESHIVLPVVQ